MADDMGEKTEEATPKRISQARGEGQVARSQDFGAAVMLLLAVVLAYAMLRPMIDSGVRLFVLRIGRIGWRPDDPEAGFAELLDSAVWGARLIVPVLVIAVVVAYLINYVQIGWLLTLKPLKPKVDKLDPVKGTKKLFGLKNFVKVGMNAIKLVAVLSVAGVVIAARLRTLASLPRLGAYDAMVVVSRLAFEIALILAIVLVIIGIVDLIYQRWQHKKDLKMTKQEVKDERRQVEPDPEVKKQQMKMYQQLVMQQVASGTPAADVVVTNPTHFSVAIKYDHETMRAPRVTAKGGDFLAFRMREIARARGIAIVERPPLARALYWGVEVGDEISPEHYEAVAELLAYVYGLDEQARQTGARAPGLAQTDAA